MKKRYKILIVLAIFLSGAVTVSAASGHFQMLTNIREDFDYVVNLFNNSEVKSMALQDEKEELEGNNIELSSEIESHKQTILSREEDINELETEKSSLIAENGDKDEIIAAKNAEIESKIAEIESLNDDIIANDETITSNNNTIAKLEADINGLQNYNEGLQREIESLHNYTSTTVQELGGPGRDVKGGTVVTDGETE